MEAFPNNTTAPAQKIEAGSTTLEVVNFQAVLNAIEQPGEPILYKVRGNPVLQAKYFGVIFNKAPRYDEIVFGTPDCTKITGVNKVFVPKDYDLRLMAEYYVSG